MPMGRASPTSIWPSECEVRATEPGRGKQVGIVLVSYALLRLPFAYPILFKLDRVMLGWPGDNLEYVWKMRWFKHALHTELSA